MKWKDEKGGTLEEQGQQRGLEVQLKEEKGILGMGSQRGEGKERKGVFGKR